VAVIDRPLDIEAWEAHDKSYERAMDSALMQFIRWDSHNSNPEWITVKNKAFNNGGQSHITLRGSPGIMCMRGYTMSLKSSLAGLTLISDMTVSCFLTGGSLLAFLCASGNFRSEEELANACMRNGGKLPGEGKILNDLKGVKLKIKHLGYSRKFKRFGEAPANVMTFPWEDKSTNPPTMKLITVADYYEMMAKTEPGYAQCMHRGKLRYPGLPVVNIGSKRRGVYIPIELCMVPAGQPRYDLSPDVVAQIIKQAAVRPQDRISFLQDAADHGIISSIRRDGDAKAFGIDKLSSEPMPVAARMLPPAKLQYGDNRILSIDFKGSWNPENTKVAHLPKNPSTSQRNGAYYAIGVIYATSKEHASKSTEEENKNFMAGMLADAGRVGLNLECFPHKTWHNTTLHVNKNPLRKIMEEFKFEGARLVVVLLDTEAYKEIKEVGDMMGLVTQCIKYKNVLSPPRGFCQNVILKVNTKLGGVNHTLASRLPQHEASNPVTTANSFQSPPKSISWVFDEPCMLVGMDVSHPDPGHEGKSIAAVVASMDRFAGQYMASLSAVSPSAENKAGNDINSDLCKSMVCLLQAFKKRNRVLPKRIGKELRRKGWDNKHKHKHSTKLTLPPPPHNQYPHSRVSRRHQRGPVQRLP
jgi:hypothetical protein